MILADAGALSVAESASALRRGRQIVAFGDPVTQRPTPFEIAADRDPSDEPIADPDERSVFERLAEIVPVETLTRSYRAGGEDLAELVNEAFYGARSSRSPGPARILDAAASASTTSRAVSVHRTPTRERSRAPMPRSPVS